MKFCSPQQLWQLGVSLMAPNALRRLSCRTWVQIFFPCTFAKRSSPPQIWRKQISHNKVHDLGLLVETGAKSPGIMTIEGWVQSCCTLPNTVSCFVCIQRCISWKQRLPCLLKLWQELKQGNAERAEVPRTLLYSSCDHVPIPFLPAHFQHTTRAYLVWAIPKHACCKLENSYNGKLQRENMKIRTHILLWEFSR